MASAPEFTPDEAIVSLTKFIEQGAVSGALNEKAIAMLRGIRNTFVRMRDNA